MKSLVTLALLMALTLTVACLPSAAYPQHDRNGYGGNRNQPVVVYRDERRQPTCQSRDRHDSVLPLVVLGLIIGAALESHSQPAAPPPPPQPVVVVQPASPVVVVQPSRPTIIVADGTTNRLVGITGEVDIDLPSHVPTTINIPASKPVCVQDQIWFLDTNNQPTGKFKVTSIQGRILTLELQTGREPDGITRFAIIKN